MSPIHASVLTDILRQTFVPDNRREGQAPAAGVSPLEPGERTYLPGQALLMAL